MNYEQYRDLVEGIVQDLIEENGFIEDIYDTVHDLVDGSEYVIYYGKAKELVRFMEDHDSDAVDDAYEEFRTLYEDGVESYDTLNTILAYEIISRAVHEEYAIALESHHDEEEDYE